MALDEQKTRSTDGPPSGVEQVNRALAGCVLVMGLALLYAVPLARDHGALEQENGVLSRHIAELDALMTEVDRAQLELRASQAQIRALTEPTGAHGPLPPATQGTRESAPGTCEEFVDYHTSEDRALAVKARAETFLGLVDDVEPEVGRIVAVLEDLRALERATPSRWPAQGDFTSGFGFRANPVDDKMRFHSGIDIANRSGTPVITPSPGWVVDVSYNDGYGRVVEIDHGFGISSLYAHCTAVLVEEGQQVVEGEQIATIGSTGRSTGPHLHFEVRIDGHPVDPLSYLPDDGRRHR